MNDIMATCFRLIFASPALKLGVEMLDVSFTGIVKNNIVIKVSNNNLPQ
jgi:hypothetical protein